MKYTGWTTERYSTTSHCADELLRLSNATFDDANGSRFHIAEMGTCELVLLHGHTEFRWAGQIHRGARWSLGGRQGIQVSTWRGREMGRHGSRRHPLWMRLYGEPADRRARLRRQLGPARTSQDWCPRRFVRLSSSLRDHAATSLVGSA